MISSNDLHTLKYLVYLKKADTFKHDLLLANYIVLLTELHNNVEAAWALYDIYDFHMRTQLV